MTFLSHLVAFLFGGGFGMLAMCLLMMGRVDSLEQKTNELCAQAEKFTAEKQKIIADINKELDRFS